VFTVFQILRDFYSAVYVVYTAAGVCVGPVVASSPSLCFIQVIAQPVLCIAEGRQLPQ